ncbi:tyrosinase cofactor [Streptomyces sp. A3M-1-3]|uniref:apotyrosinase chaperone MelC1 n=1 Tax=Streptomyces sp. A3M-1-3 TaxID=2962044 RepID=UPI0020B81C46|nr:tyrosinase cofactor [Streptomyces sp. A3M-1-3]MCP3821782.1 tyrosinase cofactor [Streptomyces sp. A3M-1-3]
MSGSGLTRRRALGAAAITLSATALATVASAASRPDRGEHDAARHGGGPQQFDEIFKGRRIKGKPHGGSHHHGVGYAVFVDGKELHVMQNADGSWISVVNHYETFSTPRAVARAAVLELQGAALVPLARA